MLTRAMRKYVMSENKAGYTKAKQTIYNNRIRTYTKQALEDLALLGERLPEEQLKEFFDAKTLSPFFRALFKLEIKASNHEDWLQIKESNEAKAKRDRLLGIGGAVLMIIGDHSFVRNLLPEILLPYIEGFPYSRNFEFIINQAKR